MYDNWLFLPLFSSLPKKREEEKEKELTKPVLSIFLMMHFYPKEMILETLKIDNGKKKRD